MAKKTTPESSKGKSTAKSTAIKAVADDAALFEVPAVIEVPLLTLSMRRQLVFWVLALIVFLLLLVLFRTVLLPFIAGMALAYFLDPVADKLEDMGASRVVATSIILLVFIVLFVLALIIIVPILTDQLGTFTSAVPGYIAKLQNFVATNEFINSAIGDYASKLRENLDKVLGKGAEWTTTVLGSLWSSGKALIDILSLLIITPIVAFYLLLDWDNMVARVDSWLPRDHQPTIRKIFSDMNAAIAGFVRGQGSVCLILGTFYAVALTMTGLNFGLLIGMFAGVISFVPFVGSVVGFVLAVGVALVQFWPDYAWIALIGGIFALGQFLEGNFLQPRMVGRSVGLHPVWLMFALAAFGALFGFVGLLVAVPVAAAIGVLVRFALSRYLQSPLYKGHGTD